MKKPSQPKPGDFEITDSKTVQAAADILAGSSSKRGLARLLPFLGPAFIASVAYMDPGNFATNIAAGAQFGYLLLWVIVASNLMAMLIQTLSAKLGIATGSNLAEHCRNQFPPWVVWIMWVLMELVAMATDLAEFLGAALGFNLLFGIPLWVAGILTAIATFLILGLERYGFRPLEAVITALVGVIAVSYLVETILDQPDWGQVAYHAVVPQFAGAESVLLAAGILGATVMPHVIFLHSALTQDRIVVREPRTNAPALPLRGHRCGDRDGRGRPDQRGDAHHGRLDLLQHRADPYRHHRGGAPDAGAAAGQGVKLGVRHLAAGLGLSSASVGTMAGQVIMQGFLHRTIPGWIRRSVTMAPSLIVIFLGFDPTRVLVLSQVVLSFGLPFAVIPLVMFTRRRDLMGPLVNNRLTTLPRQHRGGH